MSARIIHGLRVHRALLALETRAQAPLGLAAVAFALLLVGFLRLATDAEPGEVGRWMPFLPLGIAGLTAAFIAADAWSRDTHSGFERTLSRLPLRSRFPIVPRLTVTLLCAAAVAAAVTGLEPPDRAWSELWSRAREGTAVVSTVVFSALAGIALRHGLGAALVGALLGNLPVWLCAWGRMNPPPSDLDALARIALVAYLDTCTLPVTLALGLAALCFAARMRGRSCRSPWRRCALAATAACVFAAPGLVSAASAVHALVWMPYDQPGARISTTPSPDGARVIVHVSRERRALGDGKDQRWTSEFIVDTATGAVERLPADKNFHGYWIDAHTVAFHDRWYEDDNAIHALDLDTGRTWVHDSDWSDGFKPWIKEPVVRNGDRVYEYSIRSGSGSFSVPVRGFDLRSHLDQRFFLLDEEQRIVELFTDGRPASYDLDVVLQGKRRGLSLSPDDRWLKVVEYRGVTESPKRWGVPMTLLIDLRTRRLAAEIEGRGWTWRRGPRPLILEQTTPADLATGREEKSTWVLAGPDGVEPLPFDCANGLPVDLDGERWLVSTRAGGVAVHAADGTLLRTLRHPSPGESQ